MESTKEFGKKKVLVIMFYDFQRVINHTSGCLLGNGLDCTKYNMCCQITLCY
jgi:hypothetical protein